MTQCDGEERNTVLTSTTHKGFVQIFKVWRLDLNKLKCKSPYMRKITLMTVEMTTDVGHDGNGDHGGHYGPVNGHVAAADHIEVVVHCCTRLSVGMMINSKSH